MQKKTAKSRNEGPPRVGVVLVTHLDYGADLLKAASFILGDIPQAGSVAVQSTVAVEETVTQLRALVQELDTGSGVLLLTDMFGGTPTNLSLSLLSAGENTPEHMAEVITGVNLPMLLKALTMREKKLREVAAEAAKAGSEGIVVAGDLLKRKIKAREA